MSFTIICHIYMRKFRFRVLQPNLHLYLAVRIKLTNLGKVLSILY